MTLTPLFLNHIRIRTAALYAAMLPVTPTVFLLSSIVILPYLLSLHISDRVQTHRGDQGMFGHPLIEF